MPEIVVTDEQAQLITEALFPVQVRDVSGRILGVISRGLRVAVSDGIQEMKARLQRPHVSYSTDGVLTHLKSLEAG